MQFMSVKEGSSSWNLITLKFIVTSSLHVETKTMGNVSNGKYFYNFKSKNHEKGNKIKVDQENLILLRAIALLNSKKIVKPQNN